MKHTDQAVNTTAGQMKSLSGCSPDQELAIRHKDGPMMVLAGPGSGKTFVITHRILHLVQFYGISPSAILVITFTKAAAGEMQNRFLTLMGNQYAPVNFGTFHAVFFHIIKEHFHFGRNAILTEREKREILTKVIYRNHIVLNCQREFLEQVLSEFSLIKNRQLSLKTYETNLIEPALFRQLYSLYQEEISWQKKLDFDDMVFLCRKLFRDRPDVLARWQKEYRYILIDEFQDISPAQFEVIELLTGSNRNLFIVGDDDQSIYGFRGASPEIMLSFEQKFSGAARVLLSTNYRSSEAIVTLAGEVIRNNTMRFPKEIKAHRFCGINPEILSFESREEQYTYLVGLLQKEKENRTLSGCAVIFRTNQSFQTICHMLSQAKIEYTTKEPVKGIFDHEILHDFLHYLMFAQGDNSRKIFLQIMNKPLRYLQREALPEKVERDNLLKYYSDKRYMQEILMAFFADLDKIRDMPVFLAINYIRKAMGYDQYLFGKAEGNLEHYQEMLLIAGALQESAKGCKTLAQWEQKIRQEQEKYTEQQLTAKQNEKSGVSIMTMHGSKGLEYDTVFLPDCNEGIVPHCKAKEEKEIEEERRMFYVAMTRARDRLFLLYTAGGKVKTAFPSRFLPLQK